MVAGILRPVLGTSGTPGATGTVAGRPLSLSEALATAGDRSRQLEIIHAYWRLTLAVGEYRVRFEQAEQLARFRPRPADTAIARTAQASASAAAQAAEIAAVRAQYELAEAALLNSALPLPLPSDLPHVGRYRTNFEEVYAIRNPPVRARLFHRTLPVRRQGIDSRAAAVEAADDAMNASIEAYGNSAVDLFAVVAAINHWAQQRRAFLALVCDYNHDIADYALTVVGAEVTGPAVVGLLLRSASPPGVPGSPATPGTTPTPAPGRPAAPPDAIRPEPDRGPTAAGFRSTTGRETTDGEAVRAASFDQPAVALPPPAAATPSRSGAEPARMASRSESSPPRRPLLAPPDDATTPAPRTFAPERATGLSPVPRVANRVAYAGEGGLTPPSLYATIAEAKPDVQTKQLAVWLYANRNLPERPGQSVDLATCLRQVYSTDRKGLIEAYWSARQHAAQYQGLAQQNGLYQRLQPLALERRNQPSGARDMVRLHADQTAGLADQIESHVRLMEAQFELTRRAGRAPDADWLLPTTVPVAVPYGLRLESQSRALVNSSPVRRLGAAIPGLYANLQLRAAAVIQADAAQADAAAGYATGSQPIDRVLAAIRTQTQETAAFLDTVTHYNQLIAEYVLTVLPPSMSAESLVGRLVVAN